MPVVEAVKKFIMEHSLEGSSLLIGVSGGVDSLVLLHTLVGLSDDLDLYLELAHLDHGLRGESSTADAEFVSACAEDLNLPVTVARRPVRADGESVEEAARRVRFKFLSQVAEENNLDFVALGHNKNDQAETVLMHLIRGAGLRGLSGMPAIRDKYIRPLLTVTRTQIRGYAEAHDIDYRVDETNRDRTYTRNRLRHDLIPKIEREYNRNLVDGLTRTAGLVGEAREVLLDLVGEAWDEISWRSDAHEGVCLEAGELKSRRGFIRKELIRKGIAGAKGDLMDVTATHVELVENAIFNAQDRTQLDLPGITFVGDDDSACFFSNYTPEEKPEPFRFEVSVGGELTVEEAGVKLSFDRLSRDKAPDLSQLANDPSREVVSWNQVEPPIIVRTRENGDRFIPLGMDGEKKIKDFLIDSKVPVDKRDRLPLICDDRRIIWVVGYRIDERYKLDSSTDNVLLMEARDIC